MNNGSDSYEILLYDWVKVMFFGVKSGFLGPNIDFFVKIFYVIK